MAAQVALKRQQAAEDAIVLGLRACTQRENGSSEPLMTPGPLWGPGTTTDSKNGKHNLLSIRTFSPIES